MNLYSSKQRWKIVLLIAALAIVGLSLWYSSSIVKQIRNEEREKVKVWSAAIEKKANLVFLTNQLFDKVRHEEELRTQEVALAYKMLGDVDVMGAVDLSLVSTIIGNNDYIPLILVNSENDITADRNVDMDKEAWFEKLEADHPQMPDSVIRSLHDSLVNDSLWVLVEQWKLKNPPYEASADVNGYFGGTVYIYYTTSKLYQQLQHQRDSLIQSFSSEVVENSISVPVIYATSSLDSLVANNVDWLPDHGQMDVKSLIDSLGWENNPIKVTLDQNRAGLIYYEDSKVLQQLRYYPYVQFFIIGLFLLVAYLLFSTFRRAEQNQVWVGMAKETAHQLGTPLSSLMAWMELLEAQGVDANTLTELNKDVKRLETITDRFSKIGSEAELVPYSVLEVVTGVADYLRPRVSRRVAITVNCEEPGLTAPLNRPLFEWVIENLMKNAIDAMKGEGSIDLTVTKQNRMIVIDVADSGSGIPPSKFKTVFQPGYTTKKRGWGLGLSLVKRIVESYHHGKIFVKSSELGKGTTFRIMVKP